MENTTHMKEKTENECREINYKICTSIDMIKLDIVLERMVKNNSISPIESRIFQMQASALLASIRNANNRAFGFPILPPV